MPSAYYHTGTGIVFMVFVLGVDDTSIYDLRVTLLAGKNMETPLCIRLGSNGKLWRLALFKEEEKIRLDEALLQEIITHL